MKRDMDLIRLILLNLEGEEEVDLSEYTREQIEYHNYLIMDGGLAQGADMTGMGQSHPSALLTWLTSDGHDFLDSSRNETVWKKALDRIKGTGGVVALDVMKAILIAVTKEEFGL